MEFQPVIMAAGKGSRMMDLTSSMPKALLPIGNLPMIWYPINMLERAGFEEAIVIVLDSFKEDAHKQLVKSGKVKMKLDIVSIPDNEFMGTADSLRRFKDKIKRDVLLVSSDLVSDVSLHDIVNLYRTYDATVTMFLCEPPEQQTDMSVPGPKSKKRSEKEFIGFDEKGSRVLFMTSEADMEEDEVVFKRSLLRKHPNIKIRSNLTDCHLYLIKKWVINYLADKTLISSIKGELIPHLVKKQFSKQREKEPQQQSADDSLEERVKTDIFSYIPQNEMALRIQEMSTWIDHTGDMAECFHGDQIRCYAYVVNGKFCVRTNTVASYCETNRQIQKLMSSICREIVPLHPSSTIKEKSQAGDSLVDEGVSIGERVSIKKSVIGKHCTIADKVKITNSVILSHVNIAEGCNIQGCIICTDVHINEKCDLKDCIVGRGQSLTANSKLTNESIVEDNKMMAI